MNSFLQIQARRPNPVTSKRLVRPTPPRHMQPHNDQRGQVQQQQLHSSHQDTSDRRAASRVPPALRHDRSTLRSDEHDRSDSIRQ